jgi:DNA-binding transcriptional LysR family regulator
MQLSSLHLQAFLEVARTGGFSRAAAALHVSQSALSQRIANLEEELGVTLFVRDRSGARPTEAGERLLRHCRMQETLEGDLLRELRGAGDLAGEIRIGAFSTILRSVVLPALAPLVAAHPGVRVEAANRELRDLPGLLRSGEVDYVLLDEPVAREGVRKELLGYEENVLVAPRKKSPRVDIYLDHDAEDTTTERFFRLQGKKATGLKRCFLDEIYAILDGVELGWGSAVVPRHLAQGRRDLVVVPGLKPLRVPVYLNYADQPYYPKLHERVVETLKANAGKLLSN